MASQTPDARGASVDTTVAQQAWHWNKNEVGLSLSCSKVMNKGRVVVWLLQDGSTNTTVGKVVYKDVVAFNVSKYNSRISHVQQVALEKAKGAVPLPALQLELVNAKRDKQPRAHRARKNKYFFLSLNLIFAI